MSTNYYLKTSLGEGPHIGKTSYAGSHQYRWHWAIEPQKIEQLEPGDVIVDEYGHELTVSDLRSIIDLADFYVTTGIGLDFS